MLKIAVVLTCLAINALLSAVEMAFISLSLPLLKQLKKDGDTLAGRLLTYRENPERTLSILQVGITLVGAISAAVGGAGAEEVLSPILTTEFGLSDSVAGAIAVMIVVLPLTYLTVVVGELVPKTIALRHPLTVAKFGAPLLVILDNIFSPIVFVLEISTRTIARFFRFRNEPKSQGTDNLNIDKLSAQHQQYVINLVDLEKKRIRDVMFPWEKVNTVHVTQTAERVAEIVLASGHTRLPVCDDSSVLGILHTKEFMAFRHAGAVDWKSIIRPILKIKEGDSLLKALRLMQVSRKHMCLVLSNTDILIGIITLEDILEEIIGDIYDEDDDGAVRSILAASASLKLRSGQKQ
ncbi:MAG: hemolysin family protein [Bdellovibrionales bacterium]